MDGGDMEEDQVPIVDAELYGVTLEELDPHAISDEIELPILDEFDRYMSEKQVDRPHEIGPSGVDGCYRRQAYQYMGIPASNEVSVSAANLGTLLHLGWSAIIRANYDPSERDADVRIEIPGMPRAGSADDVDYVERVVTDLKGLAVDTPLPTPYGWTTMADVQVGDMLLDMHGQPTRVTAISKVTEKDCVVVRPRSGDPLVADMDHRWLTRYYGAYPWSEKTTGQMMASEKHRQIPVAEPLVLPDADLPIDPWVLGYWLGNGYTAGPRLTCDEDDLPHVVEMIRSAGYSNGIPQFSGSDSTAGTGVTVTVKGVRKIFANMGLLGAKHIPPIYLRGSYRQRLALLRGLMDSDGTWNRPRRRAKFDGTNEALRDQVYELVLTLGERPQRTTHLAHGFGKEVRAFGVEWTVTWDDPFAMQRKADLVDRYKAKDHTGHWRISFGDEVRAMTKCVQVDSPTSTYLAGRSMVVTHNSTKDRSWQWWMDHDGPPQEYWDQLELYAHGLRAKHGGDWTLRIMAINRETGRHVDYERAADPERAEALVAKVQGRHQVLTASQMSVKVQGVDPLDAVEPYPREGKGPGSFPCDWCPFMAICWPDAPDGFTPQSFSIADDPDGIGQYAQEYLEAAAEESKGKRRKGEVKQFLVGLNGNYVTPDGSTVSVRMVGGAPKREPDCSAMVEILEARDIEVPMKWGSTPRYPKISKLKQKEEK